MRSFFEVVRGTSGLSTLTRPDLPFFGLKSVRSFATAAAMAALRAGVSSRCPGGAAKTMSRTEPCLLGNSALIRSVARCVSEPGIVNSSRREPPIVATRPMSRTMIPIHVPTTRHGCVAQRRAQAASAPVERRSCAASLSFGDVSFISGRWTARKRGTHRRRPYM